MKLFDQSKWQYYVPQKLLSRLVGMVAQCEWPVIKNTFIDWFIERYHVSLHEAVVQDPHAFNCFNDFFTRALQTEARVVDSGAHQLVSPADGQLSEYGAIQADHLCQAKGRDYSLQQLLAGDGAMIDAFRDGHYATVYLAPSDYHRVHMPFAGRLLKMTHVPGQLFSVSQQTAYDIPHVFARNERVICYFQTAFGPMAVILIGAMIVASISTVWHGQVTPQLNQVQSWDYATPIELPKGAEMGRFSLGSTVIVLMPKQAVEFAAALQVGQKLSMGQAIGTVYP